MMTDNVTTTTAIQDLPLRGRHWYIVLVASMEQIIGAALSTLVGIVIPLLNMIVRPELPSFVQGCMAAMGLIGIAIGSAVIGSLSDRQGYARWFRICPALAVAGSGIATIAPNAATICAGLFTAGFGVGGGYILDSNYISELMPAKWRSFMVGVAKSSSAIGFVLPAALAVLILRAEPSAAMWRPMVWIIGALAAVTLLMRLRWADSPAWLASKGRQGDALKAARYFFGPGVAPGQNANTGAAVKQNGLRALFKGRNLLRVIYSGIPWACEGLGVYGIGVFLPILIMAMGMDATHATGIAKIINSVELTAAINFCILPGFLIGLAVVNRINHATMMWAGFVGSAAGMAVLLLAYANGWPTWVSVAAFMAFEIMLNAGPHLVTYIIPVSIYPVADRGAGSGMASFLGKLGAIAGVFLVPVLLKAGGIELVLTVTVAVMLLGALISIIFSRLLGLTANLKDASK